MQLIKCTSSIKKKYKCAYCNLEFNSKRGVSHHIKIHYKNIKPLAINTKGKMFICKFCNRSYNGNYIYPHIQKWCSAARSKIVSKFRVDLSEYIIDSGHHYIRRKKYNAGKNQTPQDRTAPAAVCKVKEAPSEKITTLQDSLPYAPPHSPPFQESGCHPYISPTNPDISLWDINGHDSDIV
jgi:hypothetical protein